MRRMKQQKSPLSPRCIELLIGCSVARVSTFPQLTKSCFILLNSQSNVSVWSIGFLPNRMCCTACCDWGSYRLPLSLHYFSIPSAFERQGGGWGDILKTPKQTNPATFQKQSLSSYKGMPYFF